MGWGSENIPLSLYVGRVNLLYGNSSIINIDNQILESGV